MKKDFSKFLIGIGLLGGIAVVLFFVNGIGQILWSIFFKQSIIENSPKLNMCFLQTKKDIYYFNDREELVTLKKLDTDPSKFKVFSEKECFGKDDKSVFFKEKAVVGADPATFEQIPGQEYGLYYRDRNNVYYEGDLVPGADPVTFRIEYENDKYGRAARDKNNSYYNGKVLTN